MSAHATSSVRSRAAQVLLGIAAIAIGLPLACLMAIATFFEIVAGDFFGLCVGGMVVLFGLLLTRSGVYLFLNRQRPTRPGALDKLWRTHRLIYLYLPYSRIDIRRR